MNSNNQSSDSSSSSRFSLILLEPGEIYFEDYLVYYHELNSPISEKPQFKSSPTLNNSLLSPTSSVQKFQFNSLEENNIKQLKGNLKICSKSIVFDPINLSSPLLKFQFKSIELIEQFDNQPSSGLAVDDFDDIYSLKFNPTEQQKRDQEVQQLRKKCFAIRAKQVTLCKINNKISPYTVIKRRNPSDQHYFQFIFTNVNDSLDLMRQLHRASTLDFEHEDLMLQLILKSRLSRQVKFDLNQLDDMFKEQIQFESEVNKISPLVANPGKIILSNMCLYYKPFNNLDNERQILKIKLKNIRYVIKRRYHLKKVGCEIIFDENMYEVSQDTKELPYLYLTFEDEQIRDEFYVKLVNEQKDKLVNLNNFSQENMLQKWRHGTISNFEYLMYLNNMADRSYNDLTQYPVFPWVLCDYVSSELDLNDPKVYRDLSKPIGALNLERITRLKRRCKEMQEATTGFGIQKKNDNDNDNDKEQPMFLYGTHYSTPAFVSFFLVRQRPEWQLCLQNGRFDHPNRLFHNFADTWRNCMESDSDVKELIPEFYDTNNYLANGFDNQLGSFLENKLELDLGVRQDNIRVNDVILPRWANNNSTQFIKKMRDALESPYVSENLHKWIDLIFGYKQRGVEALKADNLFYYLCYEGAVDLESIKNYSERKSLEIQIQEFGQIPSQLFQQPHLQKVKIDLISNYSRFDSMSTDMNSLEIIMERKGSIISSDYSMDLNNDQVNNDSFSQFTINATNFKDLQVKLNVKLHKNQINDCLFIEMHRKKKKRRQMDKFQLPLICSVSNDNWIKIYSLEEKSLFRSHNVSDFSLSSVDCIQLSNQSTDDGQDSEDSNTDPFCRTLLFLSCWDNGMYIYDMNYNRCVVSLENSHDDAVSRVRALNIHQESAASMSKSNKCAKIQYENYKIILTSSWDSLIKVWILPLKQAKSNNSNDSIRTKFLYELTFESSVVDFQASYSYLASICDDGNIYIWKLDPKNIIKKFENSKFSLVNDEDNDYDFGDIEDDLEPALDDSQSDECFTFLNSIQSSDDFGKINDCRIVQSLDSVSKSSFTSTNLDNMSSNLSTIAVCTSYGYVKIYNIETSVEIFSLRLNIPESPQIYSKLNKLYYSLDYIITIDCQGFVYFIDLKQVSKKQFCTEANLPMASSPFLSHTVRLGKSQLQSLCIYKETIICVGDSEGNLSFLSLVDI